MIVSNLKPSEQQQELITHILGGEFSWYFGQGYGKVNQFSHTLLRRSDIKGENGEVASSYYDPCITLFYKWCSENNVKVNHIYRAAINSTWKDEYKQDGITTNKHTDHAFDHKVWLFYLNQFGEGVVNVEGHPKHKPNKYDVVYFDGQTHWIEPCGAGDRRVAMVVTFD